MSGPDNRDHAEAVAVYEQGPAEAPAEAVVAAVADVTGKSPIDLDPLYDAVDPDTLNTLFSTPGWASSVTLTFEYCEHLVTMTDDGVRVSSPDSAVGGPR